MRGDFVEQQQPRPVGRKQSGVGQRDRDQHRLLLARGAFGSRLVLAAHGDRQLIAVRADQRALRRAITAATFCQCVHKCMGIDWPAGMVDQARAREGGVRQRVQRAGKRRNQPRAGLGYQSPGLGNLCFERGKPACI